MSIKASATMTVNQFIIDSGNDLRVTIDIDGKKNELMLSKGRKYIIPEYQREIKWKPKNIRMLIDNVSDGDKFLGNILITQITNEEYAIIDGQQRLTAILLILRALEKKKTISLDKLVTYSNESIKSFDVLLEKGFDDKELKKHSDYKDIVEKDILDQRRSLKQLWDEINSYIDSKIPPSKHSILKKHLMNCKINVLLADDASDSVCVDYYIDINDKAVKLDSIDILKAQLFKKDFASMTKKWTNVQKSLKSMRMNGAKYAYDDFYFHFFACIINKYYGYQLKSLNRELKTLSKTELMGETINSDTHIIEGVLSSDICDFSIKNMEACATFFQKIMEMKGNYSLVLLKDYFPDAGSGNEMPIIIFHIITALLKMENEVPKILLTKYYLDIIQKNDKANYNLIFDIYISSVLFNLVKSKKSSTRFVGIVMNENWKKELGKYAVEKYRSDICNIMYDMPVKEDGIVTEKSGQYMPKHVFAIRQFFDAPKGAGNIRCLNKHFLMEYLDNKEMTAEHFFVNESYDYVFKYGPNENETSIKCPKKKYISFPLNYLYIKKMDNSQYGNATIKEKIDYLSDKGESVFASKLIYAHFLLIKEIFDDGSFPDLSAVDKEKQARKLVRDYYINVFPTKVEQYKNQLTTIELKYDKDNSANPWSIA